MKETGPYNYNVSIYGMDTVPLRTNLTGMKLLLQSFHDESKITKSLIDSINAGKPYKNKFIGISAVFPLSLEKKALPVKVATKKTATKKTPSRKKAKR